MVSIDLLKSVVVVVVFALPLVATLLPSRFIQLAQSSDSRHTHRAERAIALLNCLSGGVFLGACLLDLLPDVEQMFDRIAAMAPGQLDSFPLAQFCVALGLFLVLTVESLVVTFSSDQHHGGHSHSAAAAAASGAGVAVTAADGAGDSQAPPDGHSLEAGPASCADQEQLLADSTAGSPTAPAVAYGSVNRSRPTRGSLSSSASSTSSRADVTVLAVGGRAGLRSALLVVALSLHSVLEGLAIGLQTDRQLLEQLFAAVLVHKTLMGFSLGVSLARDAPPSPAALLSSAAAFCLASPLGIAIGWALTEAETAEAVSGGGVALYTVNAVLQGAACGTFLYVTFFEVLPHEFRDACDRLPRVLAVVLGFALVCALLFLDPDVRAARCVAP